MDDQHTGGVTEHTSGRDAAWVGGFIVAALLFTVAWVVLGFVNDGYVLFDTIVTSYSAVAQPISGLGLGSTAAAMNAAFIAYGLGTVLTATGIGRIVGRAEPSAARPARLTFTLHGIGSVVVGLFTLEQMPLHSVGFLLVLAPIVGFFVLGRRAGADGQFGRLGRGLVHVAVPVSVVLLIAFFASFNPDAAGENRGMAGLTQRLLVLHLQGWLAAIGLVALQIARKRRSSL